MRTRRFWSALSVVVMVLVVAPPPAFAMQGLDVKLEVKHNAGTTPIPAGSPLTVVATVRSYCVVGCGSISVRLLHARLSAADGVIQKVIPHAALQEVTFVIPGEDIFWWDASTRSPYVFGYWIQASQSQGAAAVSARAPTIPGTSYERRVDNIFRARFKYPDGTPVAGARVIARPPRNGEVWEALTDSTGWASLTIPVGDEYMTGRATAAGYAPVIVRVFDSWPEEVPAEVDITGYGSHIGFTVNLGNPTLPSADSQALGLEWILSPETARFGPSGPDGGATCDPGWFVQTCRWYRDKSHMWVPATGYTDDTTSPPTVYYNIGGDMGFKTQFLFSAGTMVKTGWFHRTGAGDVWKAGRGLVRSEKEIKNATGTEMSMETPLIGPNRNVGTELHWEHRQYETSTCPTFNGGCEYGWEDLPYAWTGGSKNLFDSPEHHGEYEEGSDSFVQIGQRTSFADVQGQYLESSITLGGSAYGVGTELGFTGESATGQRSELVWLPQFNPQDPADPPFRYLVVQDGLRYGIMPADAPARVWTLSSSLDLWSV